MPPHCCFCSRCPDPTTVAAVTGRLLAAAGSLDPVLSQIGAQLDLMERTDVLYGELYPQTKAVYLDLERSLERLKDLKDQPAYSDMQCDRDPPSFCRECDYRG